MKIEPSIFKAYDIRGIYPEQINEDTAYALARAYATWLRKQEPNKDLLVAVGSDMRISSPSLKERVIAGLLDSGINVDDIGLVSTPTFYFSIGYYGYDGGLQVSASHNPKQWNGLKVVRKNGIPVSKNTGLLEMKDIIEQDSFAPLAEKTGVLSTRSNIVEDEVKEQTKDLKISEIKPFKIAIDAANAMGAIDMAALFSKIPGCEVIKLNFELDGNFPAHEADPMKEENTKQLRETVVKEKCHLGIATDGDGDRYFFIDEKGEVLPQAILRGIMAEIELKENPGATVAYDIRPGRITKDIIEQHNGKSIVTPVGHSLIKEVMIKENAIFGGESSGHYFYKLPYGTFEAPILLVTKLLRYLSQKDQSFSEVIEPFKKYAHSGEINIKVGSTEEAKAKIEEVKQKYSDAEQQFIDGITVEYPNYWFNLRASNTEPLIRFTLEAGDQKTMEIKRDEVLKILNS